MSYRQPKLTPTHDLSFTSGRLDMVENVDSVAQSLKTRLQMVRGEWFADLDEGTPYVGRILVKMPDLSVVRSAVRERILATDGVLQLLSLSLDFDKSARTLSVRFRAVLDEGQATETRDFDIIALVG